MTSDDLSCIEKGFVGDNIWISTQKGMKSFFDNF